MINSYISSVLRGDQSLSFWVEVRSNMLSSKEHETEKLLSSSAEDTSAQDRYGVVGVELDMGGWNLIWAGETQTAIRN